MNDIFVFESQYTNIELFLSKIHVLNSFLTLFPFIQILKDTEAPWYRPSNEVWWKRRTNGGSSKSTRVLFVCDRTKTMEALKHMDHEEGIKLIEDINNNVNFIYLYQFTWTNTSLALFHLGFPMHIAVRTSYRVELSQRSFRWFFYFPFDVGFIIFLWLIRTLLDNINNNVLITTY